MSERPTPSELIGETMRRSGHPAEFLALLEDNGYVIVHPDDVPPWNDGRGAWNDGWNDCRAHIFGGSNE